MRRFSLALCAAAALAGGWTGMAAAANPELTARVNGIDSEETVSAALRLVANLDLDLRIVVEWKNEEVDVDMWVKEPNGEVASYWNDDTQIGARLSPETTDGSGPEQYLLRRAASGPFEVKAEIYSDDPINPNGTARIIARFIRDFGRPGEREELIEVELLPQKESEDSDDDDAVPVGTVRVRR